MKNFASHIRKSREKKGLLAREAASHLSIDPALLSRFELGQRLPTREQVEKLAELLEIKKDKLIAMWLSEKIISEIGYGEIAHEALMLAEERVRYETLAHKRQLSKNISTLLKEIDQLKKKLEQHRDRMNQRLIEADDVEYTFESNRIEGNTLTLQETALVVADGITISGKSMREHLEAINHYDAIAFVRELAQKNTQLTEKHVLQLHHLVLRGIDKQNAGRYRSVQVRITGSAHIPPEPYLVPVLMEELFRLFLDNHRNLHPVILAAEMHERMVTIHPFIDGNGRTARLLMNLILLQNGYAIANIKGKKESRMAYYEALEDARRDIEKEKILHFVAETELESIRKITSLIQP